jgi:hypothetical protein
LIISAPFDSPCKAAKKSFFSGAKNVRPLYFSDVQTDRNLLELQHYGYRREILVGAMFGRRSLGW